jgi:hypothetical protein
MSPRYNARSHNEIKIHDGRMCQPPLSPSLLAASRANREGYFALLQFAALQRFTLRAQRNPREPHVFGGQSIIPGFSQMQPRKTTAKR